MIETLLYPFILTLLVVFIVDLSGIIEELEVMGAKWLKVSKIHIPKPFSCSLCSSWWLLIGYFLVVGKFTILTLGYSGLLAFLTPVWYDLLLFVRGVGEKVLDILNRWFGL